LLWFGSFVESVWRRLDTSGAGPVFALDPKTHGRRYGGGKRLFSGTPIRRRFEANPFFDFNAATIMMLVALGYYFSRLNDPSAPAIGTTSEFD
jgi:hypothetical protein